MIGSFQPVHAGQHDVEGDQVRGLLIEQRDRLSAVFGCYGGEPVVLQDGDEELASIRFVVHNQDRLCVVSHWGPPSLWGLALAAPAPTGAFGVV